MSTSLMWDSNGVVFPPFSFGLIRYINKDKAKII